LEEKFEKSVEEIEKLFQSKVRNASLHLQNENLLSFLIRDAEKRFVFQEASKS
jgi:hypothetical protein